MRFPSSTQRTEDKPSGASHERNVLPLLMADQELHSTPIQTTKPLGSQARMAIAAILGEVAQKRPPEIETLSASPLYLQSIAARGKFMNTVSVA